MATKVAPAPKQARKSMREELPGTPNPLDIAMMAAVSGKPLPDIARRVLEEEARLIRAQCTELRLREIGERVRAALWAILAVAAFAIVALIILIVVRAARSDALVVESFRVPPAMAAEGLTGDVVAKQVLDKVAEFQDTTQSARSAGSYDNNWGDDLKIDIPQTGATAEQIWKLLREWLGKETRISGEVIQTKDGLALTTRVGSKPGQRFLSKTGDLDALVSQGAEMIYKNTQPYRYAIYMFRTDRPAEARTVLQALAGDPSPIERKWAYVGLGFDLLNSGRIGESAMMTRRSLTIDPTMLNGLGGLAGEESALGHDQAAADLNARYIKLPITSEYDPKIAAGVQCSTKIQQGWFMRDPAVVDEAANCLDIAPYAGSAASARAAAQILRHDWQPPAVYRQPESPAFEQVERAESDAETHLYAQLESGPSPALAQALDEFRAAVAALVADPKLGGRYRRTALTYYVPLEAQALAELGRTGEAAGLISTTPLDCYLCLRVRGMVAEAQGNAPAAQRWFFQAAQQAPRLAPAFAEWGKLLLGAHHYGSAEVKLSYAAKLAPNWADPLKYWGDALAGEGKHDEAIAKYDAALKLAPKWTELRQARTRIAAN